MSALSSRSVNEVRKHYSASLKKRLCIGFFALTFTPIGMGLLTLRSMNEMNAATASVRDDYLPSTMWVGRMGIALGSVRRWQSRYILMPSGQEQERRDVRANLDTAIAEVAAISDHLEPTIRDDQGRLALLTQFQLVWPSYKAEVRQSLRYKDEGLDILAVGLFRLQAKTDFQTMIDFVRWDMDYNQNAGRAASDYSRHVSATARRMLVAGVGLTVGVCLATALSLLWHVTNLIDMTTGAALGPKQGRAAASSRRTGSDAIAA